MTRADILRQQQEARDRLDALRKLYPGAFTSDGRAIVAAARFPTPPTKD